MPWGYDPYTQQFYGYSGEKQPDTIEWHEQQVDLIWHNFEHGYMYRNVGDAMMAANIHMRRVRELRALETA